ncbi:MAG: bifunctional UDP-N-acetylglucosamine diphosphorylase/glucosamine-1-phosphate N-acetyltransferase GlmU [Actinobacteria bacterium]|nr:bifunctional UDP-N-acetylglucosamine diphosphorylase/glucosamine-1-phosphate N-acetyltransferase GlmU [Actinomycetota bacterium]
MKSDRPKVMHRVCGRSMLSWVLDALEEIKRAGHIDDILVVVGKGAPEVEEEVGERASCVVQEERKGTGHAVMIAAPRVTADELLVITADSPLVTPATLGDLCRLHGDENPAMTMLTTILEDPTGYGRIVREADGRVAGIVEESEAGPEERIINEVNTSIYVFNWEELRGLLPELGTENAKGEYFLTDAIALLARAGGRIAAHLTTDACEVLGVNSREHLAQAEAIMRQRINRLWMEEGVTMEDPSTTFIGGEVIIGRDTVLRPLVMLEGKTTVGEGCVLGPNARIVDSVLGNGVTVEQATVRESELHDGVNVGPYASLRPGSVLQSGAKAGTFVETKNTVVGKGSKVPHLSYMGDADIGDDVNVGAGSITCNYDGAQKHRTVIEDEAFIGSDTMFVAPVRIGKGSVTGAGSAITKDIPPGALGVERSAQKNILEYKKKSKKKEEGKP